MGKIAVAVLAMAGYVAALTGMSAPAVKIELKGLHLCCGGCEGAAKGAVEGAGGKEVTTDKGSGALTFSASNEKAAQKALEALAKAGFHGTTDNKLVAMPDESVGKPPKVLSKELVLKVPHNCCGACTKGIVEAAKKAEGVESADLKDKDTTLTIKGNFNPLAVMKALYEGGIHPSTDAKKK
jgi:copper chaperone CopZ